MMPSSAALQKVLGHMGAVAIRLTRLVWSENMWMVSFAVKSCTCTLVSAAPVIKIRSSEWGRNCKHTRSLRIHIVAYLQDTDWKRRNWRGLHLDREDVCCMPCVHSDELPVPEGIPDDGMLIIWTWGQETRKEQAEWVYEETLWNAANWVLQQNLLSFLIPLQTVDTARVTLKTETITQR